MSELQFTEQAIQRITDFHWRFDESLVRRYAGLLMDYLRAAAKWTGAIDAADSWPFVDFAKFIRPDLELAPAVGEAAREAIDLAPVNSTVKLTCVNYVRWSFIMDVDPRSIDRFSLPDPFIALMTMYEEGGWFSTEHGFINVGPAGIPAMVRGWKAYVQ